LKADVWESLTSDKDKYLFEMRILEVKLRILGNSQSAVIDIVNLLQEINELEQFDHERLRINVGIGLKYLKRQCAGND